MLLKFRNTFFHFFTDRDNGFLHNLFTGYVVRSWEDGNHIELFDNIDTTSLASLTAGNIAATGGIAKLLKENEFATQFHEGENANIHIQLVGNRVILVVIFDSKSSLGLVRLRVRKASDELNRIFEALLSKVQEPGGESPFAEITDEDIDNLFPE